MITRSFNRLLKTRIGAFKVNTNKCAFNSSLFNKKDHEDNKSKDTNKYWLTEKDQDFRVTTKSHHLQFSKSPILDNFGELQPGEIPEPLKYIRPFEMTVLPNGIRVCSESWDSPTAAVGVYIDAGSRYESLDTSGTAHFLEHILFKGTKNRNKNKFETEIENMGATLDAYTSREHTLFHMTCFPKDVKKVVNILGDMIQNPVLDNNSVNDEKDTIKTELEESNKDMQETIMEAAHFNCFRDHYMGQPILGDIDNINNITQEMIHQYHANNYVGKNIIVVGTGAVKHNELVDMVANEFGNINKTSSQERRNTDKPLYTPSCTMMRDDEFYNCGVGVFYDAPSWHHEDYYAFLLMERILGTYSLDRNGPGHLNDPGKQYSMFEGYLSSLADVTKGNAIYSPYKDCGLFGTYIYGNEVFARQMTYTGIMLPAYYGTYINQVEVYRARARLWQELLNIQSPTDVLQLIGPQILYLNRRVHRSEIAKRVASFDNYAIREVCRDWFYDAEPSIIAYGAIENLTHTASYKYYKINNYVTTYCWTHSLQ